MPTFTDTRIIARPKSQTTLLSCAVLFALLFLVPSASSAQQNAAPREHLTTQEIDLVRDEQRIDRRTDIFIKAIDRRLQLIASKVSSPTKQKELLKDADKYGALPPSTAAELLSDIALIFDEAITNIDDASDHKRQQELLPKALRKFSDASTRYLTQLVPMREGVDATARIALEQVIENAQSVVDAATEKLRAETVK